jgi:hypothetical protein
MPMNYFFKKIILFFLGFFFLFFLSRINNAYAVTLHMPDQCANLQTCFSQMQGGDELIIRNGIYTGDENMILGTVLPPSGTSGAYTIIRAENEGEVVFDGEEVRRTFYLSDDNLEYVEFHGLEWINPDADTQGGAVYIIKAYDQPTTGIVSHLKFFKCGAMVGPTSSTGKSIWGISYGEYYLFEDCYAWGRGRYGWKIQDQIGTNYNADGAKKVILRRCVVRLEDSHASDLPIAGIQSYCSKEIEVQNCIVLDLDSSYWTSFSYSGSAFNIRAHTDTYGYPTDIHFRGDIALNNLGWQKGTLDGYSYFSGFQLTNDDPVLINTVENSVAWDVMQGVSRATSGQYGIPTIKNLVIKTIPNNVDPSNEDTWSLGINLNTVWKIRDSVIMEYQKYAMRHISNSDYNIIYSENIDFDNYGPGANDYSDDNGNEINPLNPSDTCFDYITKIKDGSPCDGTGETGGDRGANILTKIGVNGTLWGEPGYNVDTEESLWPFPNEDNIKDAFSSYNPGGIDSTKPDGKRGFCADGTGLYGGPITLTSYIWEYLGNECPSDICNYSQSDTLSPQSPNELSVR